MNSLFPECHELMLKFYFALFDGLTNEWLCPVATITVI
jgi:hypothetical protein